jgi:hypothetical protein
MAKKPSAVTAGDRQQSTSANEQKPCEKEAKVSYPFIAVDHNYFYNKQAKKPSTKSSNHHQDASRGDAASSTQCSGQFPPHILLMIHIIDFFYALYKSIDPFQYHPVWSYRRNGGHMRR